MVDNIISFPKNKISTINHICCTLNCGKDAIKYVEYISYDTSCANIFKYFCDECAPNIASIITK